MFNLVSSDVIYSCLSGVHTNAFSLHMEVIKKTFTTEWMSEIFYKSAKLEGYIYYLA